MIHVTLVRTDIDDTVLAQMIDALSPSEQARAARFRQVEDRRRHVVARTVLKGLLAERLGGEQRDLHFVNGPHGKPMLASTALHFNLSHSGDLALIALSPVPVGIDLERGTPVDATALAQAWFTPAEQARLARGEDDFLGIWTARESVLKAAGTGLSGEPDFDVYHCAPLDLDTALNEYGERAIPHTLVRGYRAALAVSGTALPVLLVSTDATRFAPRVTLDALAPASDGALCLHP